RGSATIGRLLLSGQRTAGPRTSLDAGRQLASIPGGPAGSRCRRDAPLPRGLEFCSEPPVGRRTVPPHQLGELSPTAGRRRTGATGVSSHSRWLGRSGPGGPAESAAVGFDPNLRSHQPDEPAGVCAGNTALGTARTGNDD